MEARIGDNGKRRWRYASTEGGSYTHGGQQRRSYAPDPSVRVDIDPGSRYDTEMYSPPLFDKCFPHTRPFDLNVQGQTHAPIGNAHATTLVRHPVWFPFPRHLF
jgi:hypothetical protein